MSKPDNKEIVSALLADSGRTFADELNIHIEDNTPAPLFQLLVASLLFSARISSKIAVKGVSALFDQGWTTPRKMADSTWEERAKVLNQSGYALYDEKTSTMLSDTTDFLLENYDGDLRQLRKEAENEPAREHQMLTDFKGIGPMGANIFCREAQAAWSELYPFADDKVLNEADRLGLPQDRYELANLVSKKDFPRLVSAIMRVGLESRHDEILDKAKN